MDDSRWGAQAPGEPGEHTSGGFAHGGWHMPYFDNLSRAWVSPENLAATGGFLFGRRTYETSRAIGRTPPKKNK